MTFADLSPVEADHAEIIAAVCQRMEHAPYTFRVLIKKPYKFTRVDRCVYPLAVFPTPYDALIVSNRQSVPSHVCEELRAVEKTLSKRFPGVVGIIVNTAARGA